MEEIQKTRRLEMVEHQIRRRGVRDPRVLHAMETVARHLFVPAEEEVRAYDDSALPIRFGQTISQPYIVGLMSELLEAGPEHIVLEVGTGSGYQTMILAILAREVFTIDIQVSLVEAARKLIASQCLNNVTFDVRNGYLGWPEAAPYDRIMVTAGAEVIPAPLIEQLVTGGRLVIPVGLPEADQVLKVVIKNAAGQASVRDICTVRFVPLVDISTGNRQQLTDDHE